MKSNDLLKNFEKYGDLYELLELKPTASKKDIKKAYKEKALIYHPDKNKAKDAVEKFQKIKDAYEILSDDVLKESYEKYLKNKQYYINRKFEQNSERNKFAQDLLQKEKEYNKQKEEEAEEKLRKFFAKKEELEKKHLFKKKNEAEKQELEALTKKVNYVDESEFSKNVNSIKIKWGKIKNAHYNQEILQLIFSQYGGIKECVIFPEKKTGVIEFLSLNSAEKAYKDYNIENEEKVSDGLKVKYLMKKKKRNEIIENFTKRKNNKIDLTINTATLEKIGSIFNRDSNLLAGNQMDELKRMEERKKIMKQIIDNEINKASSMK